MSLRRLVNPNAWRLRLNRGLRRFDLGLYRRSWVEAQGGDRVVHVPVALPEGAAETLRPDHPRIAELERRYRRHPAAALSQWSPLRLEGEVELAYFRGDGQYLYQARGTPEAAYALSADYVARHQTLGLLDRLEEDGAFGALAYWIEGRCVSRDLLDSVLEIETLAGWLGADRLAKARVLDVGAGYGRLAHRLSEFSPDVEVAATDAVAVSTFLCEYYLAHRSLPRARAVPLDELDAAIAAAPFDVAVNVHGFAEMPHAAVTWWLRRAAAAGVPRLLIVHDGPELFALEQDLSRRGYGEVLAEAGYRCVDCRPKYAHSQTVQRLGVFPAWYHLFERA